MNPPDRFSPWVKRWAFLTLILINTLVALLIARQILAYQHYPFDIDEANHANGALALWLELQTSDLIGFARHFYGQSFYPPGFAWLRALAFALFGATPVVARLFTLVCLYLGVLVIYALCLELDELYGWLIGLVASALTLTVQPLLVTSALVMTEAPGLLASFVLLWSYVRVLKRPSVRRFILTGLLLTLTFLTKYTFGVVVVATLLVMELSLLLPARGWLAANSVRRVYKRVKDVATQRWLWLFGPFALAMLIWFGQPDKFAVFLDYTRPLPADQPWLSTRDLLYYPRSLALHHTPSPWFTPVTLAGLLWAAAHWRRLPIRLILLYFVTGMAFIMLVNHPENPRFIATFVPAAHVLTGAMAGWLAARWSSPRSSRLRPGLAAAGAALVTCLILSLPALIDRFTAYPSLMEVEYEASPQVTGIAMWLDNQIPQNERFVLVNYWDQFSPQALTWRMGTRPLAAGADFDDVAVPATLLPPASPETVAAWRQEIGRSNVHYVVTLEGGPWGAPPWPAYTEALADTFRPIADATFVIEQYDAAEWLDYSLLRRTEWEQVKQASRYTLNVKAVVYERVESSDG